MIDYKLVTEVLNYLEDLGWTELIDARWKQNIKNEIRIKFKDIDKETLKYILKLVLY